ncbi:hypothetical protein IH879_18140 [candidate division KSB1 bacterium]|nr:hypothetical protein [candidate division KSB1 bacterium]
MEPVKQRRKSIRLKDYDYSRDGYYFFVTICTKNREEYFGQISGDEMILNECGKIARQNWLEIPDHFEDVKLDEHVILPNHIHGIVIIDSGDEPVGNRHACSLQERQYQKLPVVIGSYKSAVTREINQIQNKFHFKWQKSFYDPIIRNDRSLHKIRHYIHYNSLKWKYDRENLNIIPVEQKKDFWKQFLQSSQVKSV